MLELVFSAPALKHNFLRVKERCDAAGVELLAVTKAVCSFPPVVDLFAGEGLTAVGDSNPQALGGLEGRSLKRVLLKGPPSALRDPSPPWEEAYASGHALPGGPGALVMVLELGDGKDGVRPDEAGTVLKEWMDSGRSVAGAACNFSCLRGLLPSTEAWEVFSRTFRRLQAEAGTLFMTASAGGTVVLDTLGTGNDLPFNQIRVGEGILLGTDSARNTLLPELRQDTAVLWAEVLEVREKSFSVLPGSDQGRDAFGQIPATQPGGRHLRAVLDLGSLAAPAGDLKPLDPGVTVVGQTFDFLVVSLSGPARGAVPGDRLGFRCGYAALSQAGMNPFVKKTLFP